VLESCYASTFCSNGLRFRTVLWRTRCTNRRCCGALPESILGRAPAPDETTILNFRHLLEEHDLGGQMLDAVNLYLASHGIRITTGTIVDATIIHAPCSTKNENKERDPEMHQAKKGNQWYFGAKAHIGVDSRQGVVAFGVHQRGERFRCSHAAGSSAR